VGVVGLDLLKGVGIGIAINIFMILKGNLKRAYNFKKEEYQDGDVIHIDLAQEVSFLNKAAIKETLKVLPDNSKVIINASDTVYIAYDVIDLINEFEQVQAKEKNIEVTLIGFKEKYNLKNSTFDENHIFVEHKEIINYRKNTITSSDDVISELKK
jgi:MFS superfamily sulfate permease-like transporter